jgi:hypothetical protein
MYVYRLNGALPLNSRRECMLFCAFFYIKSLRDLDYPSYLAYKHIFPTGILGQLYSY